MRGKKFGIIPLIATFLFVPPTTTMSRMVGGSASAQEYGPPAPYGGYGGPGDSYPDDRGGPADPYPGPDGPYADYRGATPYPAYRMSPDQLENLLAPVALYPDPLLAQVLVAATFADQIDAAARWMRAYNDPYGVDAQPWDVSVKAIAHYPKVLFMLADRIDWTTALGQAYVEQPADVSAAVQHLRFLARDAGNLATNDYWEVAPTNGFIAIEPIQPQFIFIPDYAPEVVFFHHATFAFGPAFPIGPWLNCDWDWRGHRVYYHGWHGPRWVERSRPFVRINNVYVNDRFRNIRVNRDIVRRPVRAENLNRFNTVHRDANFNNFARQNDRVTTDRNLRRNDNQRFDNGRRSNNNRGFDNNRRDGQLQSNERAARLQDQRQRDFDNRSGTFQDNRGRGVDRSQFRDTRPQGFEQGAQRMREDNRRQLFENRSNQRLENQNRGLDRPRGPETRTSRGSDTARARPANNRPQHDFQQNQRNEHRAAAQPARERGATAAAHAADSRQGGDARSAQRSGREDRRNPAL